MSAWGIKLAWDEYKPCFPGTDEHDRSVGKWVLAGEAWLTDFNIKGPVLFECLASAAAYAPIYAESRRSAHPPFILIAPARYGPTSPGMVMSCAGPDLSGLGGFLSGS